MPLFIPTMPRAPVVIVIMVVMPPVVMNPNPDFELNSRMNDPDAAATAVMVLGRHDDDLGSNAVPLMVPLVGHGQSSGT